MSADTPDGTCTCPRTDGYRIKRRGCPAHAEKDAAHWQRFDDRKFGTNSPHEPTDEFVRRAFAEGAWSLWPDSRDPGWIVTFDRWLAARVAAERERADAAEAALTGARDDIRDRRREFQGLGAEEQYLLALDDAFGLVSNRLRAALGGEATP